MKITAGSHLIPYWLRWVAMDLLIFCDQMWYNELFYFLSGLIDGSIEGNVY